VAAVAYRAACGVLWSPATEAALEEQILGKNASGRLYEKREFEPAAAWCAARTTVWALGISRTVP